MRTPWQDVPFAGPCWTPLFLVFGVLREETNILGSLQPVQSEVLHVPVVNSHSAAHVVSAQNGGGFHNTSCGLLRPGLSGSVGIGLHEGQIPLCWPCGLLRMAGLLEMKCGLLQAGRGVVHLHHQRCRMGAAASTEGFMPIAFQHPLLGGVPVLISCRELSLFACCCEHYHGVLAAPAAELKCCIRVVVAMRHCMQHVLLRACLRHVALLMA